jgi:hypothetical protein
MNYPITVTWILIAGLSLVVTVSSSASSNKGEKAEKGIVELANKKPATDATSDRSKKKPASPGPEQKKKKTATTVGMPVYKPPLRGAPGGRVGGGTRGIFNELIFLCVLAPDHVGLTVQEQPHIYWFVSKLTTYPIEFTIIENQAVKPLLEKRIRSPEKPGVQYIRLSDHGVHLRQNVQYKWFLALVPDPDRRSKDILAGGVIERVEFPETVRVKLDQAGEARQHYVYAEAGLWYDALSAISDLIDTSPNDTVLRKQRASLLEQVGLPEIAQYEMKRSISGCNRNKIRGPKSNDYG